MTGKDMELGFKSIGGEIRNFYSKNKTHIFTGLSIAGTIATGISAAKSGARSARRIDEREEELGRQLTRKEKFGLCWKDAVLPIGLGLGACLSSLGTDIIATDAIARSNAALIMSERAYETLSKKTKQVLGEKKEKEIKDEIAKEKVKANPAITVAAFDDAPRTGTGQMYPFVDDYTGLMFWSNVDYINCCILKLQEHMRNLQPRGTETDYYDKCVGVPYREWLKYLGFSDRICNTPERKNKGWNKGFQIDGSGDDPIEAYRTTMELEPGFAVTVIKWECDPTDMKLGRLIKSSEL